MPRRPQKLIKTVLDSRKAVCYTVSNDGREFAESPVALGARLSVDFQGPPESESKQLHFDSTQLHWLWNETRRQLQRYATRADEGVEIQAAMDFAHWVQFSGLIKIFKDNPQPDPLPVDGKLIDKLVRDLVMDCGDYLKLNTPGFVRVSQIELVNRKLDLLAGQLSKLSPPLTDNTVSVGNPADPVLHVIQGGVT